MKLIQIKFGRALYEFSRGNFQDKFKFHSRVLRRNDKKIAVGWERQWEGKGGGKNAARKKKKDELIHSGSLWNDDDGQNGALFRPYTKMTWKCNRRSRKSQ